MDFRVFSFGGGVQSHAVLAMQALGLVPPYDAFVFANVGAKAESPDTLAFIEAYTKPFCVKHGIKFVEVQKKRRNGTPVDLYEQASRPDLRSVIIPAYTRRDRQLGKKGGKTKRNCTVDYKIKVVDAWIKKQGVANATVGLGISTDEIQRVRSTAPHDRYGKNGAPLGFIKMREYPLIDAGVSRQQCFDIIAKADLPIPPRSACFFCPLKRKAEWLEMRTDRPDLWEKSVAIENALNGKGLPREYFLSAYRMPLQDIPYQQPLEFPDPAGCDEGVCFT